MGAARAEILYGLVALSTLLTGCLVMVSAEATCSLAGETTKVDWGLVSCDEIISRGSTHGGSEEKNFLAFDTVLLVGCVSAV